jgi:ATP-binding cassette, subfamily B, bacterial
MNRREFTITDEYQYNRSNVVAWLLSHLLRYKFYVVLFLGSIVLQSLLAAAIPVLTGRAFNQVLSPAASSSPLLLTSLFILGVVSLRGAVWLLRGYSVELLAHRLERDVRDELFLSLLGKSQTFHNRHRIGDLIAHISGDVRQLSPMLSPGVNLILDSLISLVVPLVFIRAIRVELLLAPILFIVAFFFALYHYMQKLIPVAGPMREQFGLMNANLIETITGIEVVKSVAQEDQEQRKFEQDSIRYRDLYVREGDAQAQYTPTLLLAIASAGAFLHGVLLIWRGNLTIGDLVAYIGLVGMLRIPTSISIFTFALLQFGIIGAERILKLIREEVELDENKDGYRAEIQGRIVFQDVCFGYDDTNLVLRNISFCIEPGQTVAVVGSIGSGKSTLAKLISRNYDIRSGSVQIDQVDVRDWQLEALRSQVSMIDQGTFLFSRSIAENIAFGTGQLAQSSAIEQAARDAQAHDFIMGFRDGYATIIGERGVTLSGGQRQRVAIARALLANPRVLILDDSTSAVDSATEDAIQQAIQRVLQGRTTVLITHRLSQIRAADKILILHQGELIDQGTHTELFTRCDLYRRIFARHETIVSVAQRSTAATSTL